VSAMTSMTQPQREFYRRVGARLRDVRTRKGLSQRQLALRLGVTAVAIHYWEHAKHAPTLWHVRELERVLGQEIAP
jgi:transcriptional regulator with XRE-family HTH domain